MSLPASPRPGGRREGHSPNGINGIIANSMASNNPAPRSNATYQHQSTPSRDLQLRQHQDAANAHQTSNTTNGRSTAAGANGRTHGPASLNTTGSMLPNNASSRINGGTAINGTARPAARSPVPQQTTVAPTSAPAHQTSHSQQQYTTQYATQRDRRDQGQPQSATFNRNRHGTNFTNTPGLRLVVNTNNRAVQDPPSDTHYQNGTSYSESDADDEDDGRPSAIDDSSPMRGYENHSPMGNYEGDTSAADYSEREAHGDDEDETETEGEDAYSEHEAPMEFMNPDIARLTRTMLPDWSPEDCHDFATSIGLGQYSQAFIEHDVNGEAMVALVHEDLKQMGVRSVGHRLLILNSIYDVKIGQDITIEPDQYKPKTATNEEDSPHATAQDLQDLIRQIRVRDQRMVVLENQMRQMRSDYKRLREDMLPAIRMAKDAQKPLPQLSDTGAGPSQSRQAALSPTGQHHQTLPTPSTPAPLSSSLGGGAMSAPAGTAVPITPSVLTSQNPPAGQALPTGTSNQSGPTPPGGPGVKRQYSLRKILRDGTPQGSSPTRTTHNTQPPQDKLDRHGRKDRGPEQTIDPAGAAERAVAASSHMNMLNSAISASAAGTPSGLHGPISNYASPKVPSPTSPRGAGHSAKIPMSRHNPSSSQSQSQVRKDQKEFAITTEWEFRNSVFGVPKGEGGRTLPDFSKLDTRGDPSSERGVYYHESDGGNTPIDDERIVSVKEDHSANTNTGAIASPGEEPLKRKKGVEIFKSFRVGIDDTCRSILPEALAKYRITAPWQHYALVIVYGGGERALGPDEKPLTVYKQLDRFATKPMFMLRKLAADGSLGEYVLPVPGGVL